LIPKKVIGWLSKMMLKNAYRLGEYRIAEDEHDLLRWETHFNFGVQRSGKCYIFGNVVILGKWSHEEGGYLQLEFSELLKKLPVWNRTQYYCFISELLNVSTGQSITNEFIENYQTLTGNTISKPIANISPGMFRLGRYQITIADKEEISWQTYEGLDRIIGGHCIIESGLLLIGPQEYEEWHQKKRAFLDKLNKLSKWDKTVAWCQSAVLRPCSIEPQRTENHNVASPVEFIIDEYSFDKKPSRLHFDQLPFNQYKKPPKKLSQFNFKGLKTAWSWIYGARRWLKYLIPLVLVGLLLCLLMIWYSEEKKSLFHHGDNRHHREHDD
jgi:hypothetical protein